MVTAENWKELVFSRLQQVNWENIIEDVRPFVEPNFDLSLLSLENFENLLS